jgi:Domain of unknown function (DUF4178)
VGTVLIVVFVALIVAGVVVFVRGRRAQAGVGGGGDRGLPVAPAAAPSSGVHTLKLGDVVNHDGADWIVEGTTRLNQDGFTWQEHRLVDGERSLWLSVEDDEGLEVVVWERASGTGLEPGAEELTHEGVSYELEERGKASFTSEGSTATGPSGRVEFVDYAAGDNRLAFERYGDDAGWEVGVGHVISEHSLDIYPSSGGAA